MAFTLIRGTQILDGTIPLSRLVTGYLIPTANLQAGASFIDKNGSIAFSANQSMGGNLLQGLGTAVNSGDAVNLSLLQTFAAGFASSKGARAFVTTNVSLTGLQNFDGLTGAAGNIVWLNAQTTGSQNGFWTMNAGAWTRPSFWAAASSQKSFPMYIQEGTTYADTKWTVATDAIVVDTTTVTAIQDQSAQSYTAGNGILQTGNVFSAKVGNGLNFDGTNQIAALADGTSLTVSATGIKISNGTAGTVLMANASGAATYTALSGDATISSTGVVTVPSTGATGFVKVGKIKVSTVPSGAINSSNTAFTLASTPVVGTEAIYFNGQRLFSGAGNDYTISGTAITVLSTPITGDRLTADYLEA